MPAGEMHSGNLIVLSRHVVEVVRLATSTSTRDRSRYLLKAELFSAMVVWNVEPELKNSGRGLGCGRYGSEEGELLGKWNGTYLLRRLEGFGPQSL